VGLKRAGDKVGAINVMRQVRELLAELDNIMPTNTNAAESSPEPVASALDPALSVPDNAITKAIAARVEVVEGIQEQAAVAMATACVVEKNGATSVPTPVPLTPAECGTAYEELAARLDMEIGHFGDCAKAHYAGGKSSREEQVVAVTYNKIKKQLVAVQQRLVEMRAAGEESPVARREKLRIQREIRWPEIPVNAMEVTVEGCSGLTHPSLKSKDISSYVLWTVDVGGALQKDQTPIAYRNADPKFLHKTMVAFDRTNAGAKKWKYTKINFEVWHHRTLWRHALIGKATLKLSHLVEKCDLKVELKLKLEQKNTGSLRVACRLQYPIAGRDVRVVEEQYTTISTSTGSSSSSPAPTSTSGGTSMPAPTSLTTSLTSNTPRSTAHTEGSTDPHDVLKMVSNDVLEAELVLSAEAIAAVEKRVPSFEREEELEELRARVRAITIQLEVLVTRVQNGKLTIEDYLVDLRADLGSSKALVIALREQGRQADAMRVLRRVKITASELSGAEANMGELE
jgi:hypothetical protein